MDLNKIESYFDEKNTDGLNVLLDNYKETFEVVDNIATGFLGGAIEGKIDLEDALNKLTGAFMSLNVVATVAGTFKTNSEDRFFNSKRMELEKEGAKVVAAQLEREASEHVAMFRRIRNIFEAYRSNCEKGIMTCQSKLNLFKKEKDLPQG